MGSDSGKFEQFVKNFEDLQPQEQATLLELLEQHKSSPNDEKAAQGRSALDGFKERGLLGSVTDAPVDWGANPKYMEGFGRDDR